MAEIIRPQAELIVSVSDVALANKIKHAIELMKGVCQIKTRKIETLEEKILKSNSYKKSLEDIKNDRVYTYDSLDDFVKEIEG